MTPLAFIAAASTVLGIVALVSAAVVVIRSSAAKAAVAVWREEAEAQKARGDRLEAAVEDLRGRVSTLEADNKRLVDLATGATAIRELTELVRVQHSETLALLAVRSGPGQE